MWISRPQAVPTVSEISQSSTPWNRAQTIHGKSAIASETAIAPIRLRPFPWRASAAVSHSRNGTTTARNSPHIMKK